MSLAVIERGKAAEPGNLPVLDRAHLSRVTLGSSALAREVLDLFIGQVPSQLGALAAAQPGRSWFEAAHGLKGSARAIGAAALAEVAAAAEKAASDPDPARRTALLAQIRAITQATIAEARAETA